MVYRRNLTGGLASVALIMFDGDSLRQHRVQDPNRQPDHSTGCRSASYPDSDNTSPDASCYCFSDDSGSGPGHLGTTGCGPNSLRDLPRSRYRPVRPARSHLHRPGPPIRRSPRRPSTRPSAGKAGHRPFVPEDYTENLKRDQMAEYADTNPISDYEEDHLIPLELGGSPTSPLNLWPEPGASPNPKDAVEVLPTAQSATGA